MRNNASSLSREGNCRIDLGVTTNSTSILYKVENFLELLASLRNHIWLHPVGILQDHNELELRNQWPLQTREAAQFARFHPCLQAYTWVNSLHSLVGTY